MTIRFATPQDSAALLRIYARYITTPVTFEYALPSEREFAARIAGISSFYPYLVHETDGEITGYAYAHRHMEREAYQWNAELSVYLDPAVTSRGLGKKLYRILMDMLALQRVKTVYGCVTLPNAKSEGLHTSLGFRLLGVYRNAGYKDGQWHDVGWFEKRIAPYGPEPEPVIPLSSVAPERLRKIIASAG